MSAILVLTKNLLVEQTLQEQLQYLSYEVFCSVELFNLLKANDQYKERQNDYLRQLLANYQAVVLSETISDSEIQTLMPLVTANNRVLMRKLNSRPSKREEEQIKKSGVDGWIITDNSIDSLREQLVEKLAGYHKEEAKIVFLYPNQMESGDIVKLQGSLSNREKAVLDCLLKANGEIVSRDELCAYLWNEAPNNSHLSQASVLIKRIKMKLELAGYDPEMLKTIWGRGYLLVQSTLTNEYFMEAR